MGGIHFLPGGRSGAGRTSGGEAGVFAADAFRWRHTKSCGLFVWRTGDDERAVLVTGWDAVGVCKQYGTKQITACSYYWTFALWNTENGR